MTPQLNVSSCLLLLLLFPIVFGQAVTNETECAVDPSNVVVSMRMFAADLTQATALLTAQLPGEDQPKLFVVEQNGVISMWDFDGNSTSGEVFVNITDRVIPLNPNYDERGLLGVAFAPDFNVSGTFYLYYSTQCANPIESGSFCPSTRANLCSLTEYNHVSNLEEWSYTAEQGATFGRTIMRINQPFSNHNGVNNLHFNPFEPDLLFLGLGDGGSANDPYENAQNPEKVLGKLLAFDTSLWTEDTTCDVVTDNFTTLREECPSLFNSIQVFALGIRNPSGFTFEELPSGEVRIILTDVGQVKFEEVHFLYEPLSNLGWDIREGFKCVDADRCLNVSTLPASYRNASSIAPVTVLPHNSERLGYPIAVLNGLVYQGSELPCPLRGSYVFGNLGAGGDTVIRNGGIGRLYFIQQNDTADVTMIPGCDVPVTETGTTSYEVELDSRPPVYIPYNILFDNINMPDSYFFTAVGGNADNTQIFVAVNTASGPQPGTAYVFRVVPIETDPTVLEEELVQL